MVESYFKKQLVSLKANSELLNEISGYLAGVNKRVSKKIIGKSQRNLKSVSLQDLIEKNLVKLNAADVELNLRRAKLREAKRFKKDLEAKLGHITESIETWNSVEEFPAKIKQNLLDSQVRHTYFEEEKNKAKEVQKKTVEYHLQQKKRQKKIQKHIQELEKIIEEEQELKKAQVIKQKQEKEQEYKDYLKKIHEKKILREKELEEIKKTNESLKKIKNNKPLYVKISEKYWKEIEMPELEKRKAELSKKRIKNNLSSHQLLEHAKWYETIKQDNLRKSQKDLQIKSIDRKVQSSDSTFTFWKQKLIEEEKNQKEEQKRIHDEKMKMLDKRLNYANFVKQTIVPSIDSGKRKEIEQRKIAFSGSSKNLSSPIYDLKKNEKSTTQNVSESSTWKPHKFKENPLAPKIQPKREGKIIDYLGEIRKMREDNEKEKENQNEEHKDDKVEFEWDENIKNLPEAERVKMIQKKTKKIEKILKQKELAMSASVGTSQSLKYSDDINEMLINSIKAKLAVLEKNT